MGMIDRNGHEELADVAIHPDLRPFDQRKLPVRPRRNPALLLDELSDSIPRLVKLIRVPEGGELFPVLLPI